MGRNNHNWNVHGLDHHLCNLRKSNFNVNEKRMYDFLFNGNGNVCSVCHHFQDSRSRNLYLWLVKGKYKYTNRKPVVLYDCKFDGNRNICNIYHIIVSEIITHELSKQELLSILTYCFQTEGQGREGHEARCRRLQYLMTDITTYNLVEQNRGSISVLCGSQTTRTYTHVFVLKNVKIPKQ